jgi:hypothetical protein
MKQDTINKAIDFLLNRGYSIPVEIIAMKTTAKTPEQKEFISQFMHSFKGVGYPAIRSTMWAKVYDNVYGYLDSTSNITKFRDAMVFAVSEAYMNTLETAWIDGGSQPPIDDDTVEWAKSELSSQLFYVDSLFSVLKQLRKEGDVDLINTAFQKADGYASALDAFYNYVKTSAYGGRMLTFVGSDGRESCSDCRRLKGQRKRASWWTSHEFVPPSRHFECRGYNCDHYLVDDAGNVFTI